MKSYEEILKMFNLEDEKVYFNNKGLVSEEDVIITEDYTWSECGGMLYGSECEFIMVLRDGKELSSIDYFKFDFKYIDKTERFDENGKEYHKNKSYEYVNRGINLSGCEVYVLYNNYSNNQIDSYNIDIYTIK